MSGHLADRIEGFLCPGMGLTGANQGSWPEQGDAEKLHDAPSVNICFTELQS